MMHRLIPELSTGSDMYVLTNSRVSSVVPSFTSFTSDSEAAGEDMWIEKK